MCFLYSHIHTRTCTYIRIHIHTTIHMHTPCAYVHYTHVSTIVSQPNSWPTYNPHVAQLLAAIWRHVVLMELRAHEPSQVQGVTWDMDGSHGGLWLLCRKGGWFVWPSWIVVDGMCFVGWWLTSQFGGLISEPTLEETWFRKHEYSNGQKSRHSDLCTWGLNAATILTTIIIPNDLHRP